jgi:hypothetical protein
MSDQESFALKKLDLNENQLDRRLIAGLVLIILVGIASGYGISRLQAFQGGTSGESQSGQLSGVKKVKVGETYGDKNENFSDEASGVIERNEDDGEGTHKLLREGGESQTA